MVVAAIKGVPLDPVAHYEQIVRDRDNPQPHTVQAEPLYRLPAPRPIQRFVFAPDMLDEASGLKLIEEQGPFGTRGNSRPGHHFECGAPEVGAARV